MVDLKNKTNNDSKTTKKTPRTLFWNSVFLWNIKSFFLIPLVLPKSVEWYGGRWSKHITSPNKIRLHVGSNWLVVYLPLWKIWVRQMGVLFPTGCKNKIHVPNHQPNKYYPIKILPKSNPICWMWFLWVNQQMMAKNDVYMK